MPEDATGQNVVHIVVDGRQVEARPGEMVIAAAERAGTFIPRFCYHPRMKPVGMCRMCLVEISGPRGFSLQPACYVPVSEGQEVRTTTPAVKKAQDGVLEFLLINHPLDCPVCDKGGECPLQDQTMAYGPGESRFVEEKRHWAKPIPISELVLLDRERCIQCGRCTRFAAEVAGEAQIDFAGRGDRTEVAIFERQPFSSYFSVNTVQICPVGALTAKPYRFRARPWDLEQVESSCTLCTMGCRAAVQSSSNRLTRLLGIDSDPVNQSWLCDKGRFFFEAVHSERRILEPALRKGGELVTVSWPEAVEHAAGAIARAIKERGPEAVAAIGGARLANEDAYAWAKLLKGLIGTDSVDAQLGDGLPPEVVVGLERATIAEACEAGALVLVTGDLREEVPVLWLRLRQAALERSIPVIELSPVPTSASSWSTLRIGYRPGEVALVANALVAEAEPTGEIGGARAADLVAARRLLEGAGGPVVVVGGRPSLAERSDSVAEALVTLLGAGPARSGHPWRLLPALRRGNLHGALDAGLAPGLLPGRVALEAGSEWFRSRWGAVPSARGRDTEAILRAASAGDVVVLVLLGADPLADFPDAGLAREGMAGAATVIAVDCLHNASVDQADVVLPVSAFGERSGTFTNLEGRLLRLGQKVVPAGLARSDWEVAADIAEALGSSIGADSLEALAAEVSAFAPALLGVSEDLARDGAFDGVLRPPGRSAPETGLAAPARPLDPIEVAGIASVAVQGASVEAGAVWTMPASSSDRGSSEPVPALIGPPSEHAAAVPPLDAYGLRLVAPHVLMDSGALSGASPALKPLVASSAVSVNRRELDKLGARPGDLVQVRSRKGVLSLPVRVDDRVPEGIAVVPFNLDPAVSELIEVTEPVTVVHLESR
jgi:NADH-quinone oxidoreductase subunit G